MQLQKERHLLGVLEGLAALKNLASVYWDLNRREDALTTYLEVYRLEKEQHGPQDNRTLKALGKIIEVARLAESWPVLEPLYQDRLTVLRAADPDTAKVADDLAGLGCCFLYQDKFKEAEEPLRKCLALREKLISGKWQHFSAQLMLGISLLGQNKTPESALLLDEAWKGIEKVSTKAPASGKQHIGRMLEILVRLTSAPPRAAEKTKWQQRLVEFQQAFRKPGDSERIKQNSPADR